MSSGKAYRDLVNQKLHFARLVLAQSDVEYRGEEKNRDVKQALYEGAALQLKSAYCLYLREIADNYQCAGSAVIDTATLNSALADLDKAPGEVQELVNLEADSESWLARLLAVCEGDRSTPLVRSPVAARGSITAVEVGRSGLDAEQIQHWQEAFTELIERQRELMAEC